jgi:hypothetical protein
MILSRLTTGKTFVDKSWATMMTKPREGANRNLSLMRVPMEKGRFETTENENK